MGHRNKQKIFKNYADCQRCGKSDDEAEPDIFFCSSGWPLIPILATRQRAAMKSSTSQSPPNSVISVKFSLKPGNEKEQEQQTAAGGKKENFQQVRVVTEIKHDKERPAEKVSPPGKNQYTGP